MPAPRLQENWLEFVRAAHGEEYAVDAARELSADPWLALKWFVEISVGHRWLDG